jgi:hypothetical protein
MSNRFLRALSQFRYRIGFLPAFAACAFAASISANAAALNYLLTVRPGQPAIAEVALDLPFPRDGTEVRLWPRASDMGLQHQIEDVRCDRHALPQKPEGKWTAGPSCRRVTWKLRFLRAQDLSVIVSAQASLYFKGPDWWLVSEPTSLLRVEGMREAGTLTVKSPNNSRTASSTSVADGNARLVPATNNAPEFYAFGAFASKSLRLNGLVVTYVIDDPVRFARYDIAGPHHRVLNYLATVVGMTGDGAADDKAFTVVWIGVDAAKRHIGGAAGGRSLLVNYPVGETREFALNRLRVLMVVAHEQFHQLAGVVHRNGLPSPVWISEGLAQYYGLKALMRIGEDESEVQALFDRIVKPDAPVGIGLLETNRRYLKSLDQSLYPNFYTQGATFWYEVDVMLRKASRGSTSLDDLIPMFLAQRFSLSGELPQAFVDELRRRDAAEADRILEKYVGN